MRLVQFHYPGKGKRVGWLEGEKVLDITSPEEGIYSTLHLIEKWGTGLEEIIGKILYSVEIEPTILLHQLDRPSVQELPHLLIPIDPPEVWGCGITCRTKWIYLHPG